MRITFVFLKALGPLPVFLLQQGSSKLSDAGVGQNGLL